ncbi:MAG: hypothetical protein GX594_10380 [Pirellulaceae bacterium]|nr:hypothetical protein [Pirellulaceae bacterium]
MKFVLRPQHRTAPRAETRIALFPFLAVLICTMGALVPLLMAITYVAKQQAEQEAAAKAAKLSVEAQARIEDARWRSEQLVLTRQANEAKLAEMRLELSHLEDHERRLREQLEARRATLERIERPLPDGDPRDGGAAVELRRLQAEIDAAERRLVEARRAAARQKTSYAIVPYEGPNQTRRRPIYIECRADAVVLQPEGIELTDADFDGPLGPGNPLAAALRAASEHIQSRSGYDHASGTPYPMLLVRPDGIEAYYAARAAMTSWAADFGYELIDGDWQLAYQQSDPQLTETLRQVVSSARVRQSRLAAAAPSHSGVTSKVVYRASSGGGFVRERADADSPAANGYRPAETSPRREEPVTRSAAGATAAGGYPSAPPPDRYAPSTASGHYGAENNPLRDPRGGELPDGRVAGQPPREGSDGAQAAGETVPPGQWMPTPPKQSTGPASGDAAENMDGSPGNGCPMPKNLTEKRGKDWGLRDASRGAVGITRPIRVECRADMLIIHAERGLGDTTVVALGPRLDDSVDELISAVWGQIEAWGIAGQNMFWRPSLNVAVAPGGERRFQELKTMLDGSGIAVERR